MQCENATYRRLEYDLHDVAVLASSGSKYYDRLPVFDLHKNAQSPASSLAYEWPLVVREARCNRNFVGRQ